VCNRETRERESVCKCVREAVRQTNTHTEEWKECVNETKFVQKGCRQRHAKVRDRQTNNVCVRKMGGGAALE